MTRDTFKPKGSSSSQDDIASAKLIRCACGEPMVCPECTAKLTAATPAPDADLVVRPIERDEDFDRTYIPLPGGWEVQTKGRGSSFRIAGPGNFRLLIEDRPYLHETLERMARDIHAALANPPQSAAAGDGVEGDQR